MGAGGGGGGGTCRVMQYTILIFNPILPDKPGQPLLSISSGFLASLQRNKS